MLPRNWGFAKALRRKRGNELSPEGGPEGVHLVESSGIAPRGAESVDLPDGRI
jgi:hypothetical protein